MKILPRAKQVLVKPDDEKPRVSESGLLTPDNIEQEQKAFGTIESVGSGIEDLKAGDRVIYGAFAGEKLNLSPDPKKVDYVLLFDDDVLAKIED